MKSTLGNYGDPTLFVQRSEPFVNETSIFSTLQADIRQKSQFYLEWIDEVRSRDVHSCIGEQKIISKRDLLIREPFRSHSNDISKRPKTLRVDTLRAFYILSSVRSISIRNVYYL